MAAADSLFIGPTCRITVYANSISVGGALYICTATDGVGFTKPVGRLTWENPAAHKKTAEKALIPLPPTGFASFFCANRNVVQMILQPRRAVGLCSKAGVSQFAKF
jgi:hypothetical protein